MIDKLMARTVRNGRCLEWAGPMSKGTPVFRVTGFRELIATRRLVLLELGPKKFAEWARRQKQLLVTETAFRDAHQSLFATRLRTFDMLAVADVVARCSAVMAITPPP